MGEKWYARRDDSGVRWEIVRRDSGPTLYVYARGMEEEDAQQLVSLLNAVWRWGN